MKYYRIIIMGLAVTVMMIIAGCGGHRSAHLEQTESGIKHRDTNVSILQPSISPKEMSKAKLNMALAEQIKQGETANFAGKYTGVIVNQDRTQTFFFHHPSRNQLVEIYPGEFVAIKATSIPSYIHGRFEGEDEWGRYRIYKKQKIYNGIDTDFGARVEYD